VALIEGSALIVATHWAVPLSIGVFIGIIVCLDVGYRLGRRHSESSAHEGIGAIEASVFGLLGLLLAFSFAGGTSRLDTRRQLIIEEANAIGTAYLRLDLLAVADQAEMRRWFREYLDSRLRVYQKLRDLPAAEQEIERAVGIQQRIWSRAVAASRTDNTSATAIVLLPAINQMIDVTTSRSSHRMSGATVDGPLEGTLRRSTVLSPLKAPPLPRKSAQLTTIRTDRRPVQNRQKT
jgi:hypothetical protein